jgi:hypothetical protein
VVRPHEDLGRAGPVCPFVPGALERKTLWLAPEQVADRGVNVLVFDTEAKRLPWQPGSRWASRRCLTRRPAYGQDDPEIAGWTWPG